MLSPGRVSIVILTYNRREILRGLLDSVRNLLARGVEIVVVDNHSTDGTEDMMRTQYPSVVYLRTPRNVGVAARNLGLRAASSEVLVCLDDDVFGIDLQALTSIVTAFDSDPTLAAINFRVVDPGNNALCNWVHHRRPDDYVNKVFDTYEITEGAVAFRKSALEAVGYYVEYFFLSHEGPDLALRLMDRGYRVIYRGDLIVQHWHATQGRSTWMTYYYDTRNQFWLAARNFPPGYALRYLLRGQPSMFVYGWRDGYLRYWMRGVRDGVLGIRQAWSDRKRLTKGTMAAVSAIDKMRPSIFYLARERLVRRGMRL